MVKAAKDGKRQIASGEWIVFRGNRFIPEYLARILVSDFFHSQFMQTVTGVGGSLSRANPKAVGEILIPLPPLEVQREIVEQIEGYQRVIDGARAVLANYRAHILIDPAWPMRPISGVAQVNPKKSELKNVDPLTSVSFVPMAKLNENNVNFEPVEVKALSEVVGRRVRQVRQAPQQDRASDRDCVLQ